MQMSNEETQEFCDGEQRRTGERRGRAPGGGRTPSRRPPSFPVITQDHDRKRHRKLAPLCRCPFRLPAPICLPCAFELAVFSSAMRSRCSVALERCREFRALGLHATGVDGKRALTSSGDTPSSPSSAKASLCSAGSRRHRQAARGSRCAACEAPTWSTSRAM